jgi:hypothetical protein
MRLSRCESTSDHGHALRYGQYFEGITDVISRDDYGLLVDAASTQLERDISLADIQEISIYAEKHGSDYHPARIEVMVGDLCAPFVMNVAVTVAQSSQEKRIRICSCFWQIGLMDITNFIPASTKKMVPGNSCFGTRKKDVGVSLHRRRGKYTGRLPGFSHCTMTLKPLNKSFRGIMQPAILWFEHTRIPLMSD